MLSKCVFLPDSAKKALKKDLSDMDYLRSKIVEKSDMVDEKEMEKNEEDDANAADEDEDEDEEEEESPDQHTDSAYKPAVQNMVSVIKLSWGLIWNSWLLNAHLFMLFIHYYRLSRAQGSQSSYEVLHSTSKR